MLKIIDMEILKNEKIGPDYYLIQLSVSKKDREFKPGQFFHLRVNNNNSQDPLLRRPFSIHNVKKGSDKNSVRIDFAYRVVGRGTKLMTAMKKGEKVDAVGPLGNAFDLQEEDKFKKNHVWIIGGGMGMVPLYYLTKINAKDKEVTAFLGASSDEEIKYFEKIYSQLNINLKIATMDGSRGYHGNVMDMLKNNFIKNNEVDYIYTCGPEPMLKAVQEFAIENNLEGEAALEEKMGCGIGVCLSCTCKTTSGNKRVCREGPVFKLNEVCFDE